MDAGHNNSTKPRSIKLAEFAASGTSPIALVLSGQPF